MVLKTDGFSGEFRLLNLCSQMSKQPHCIYNVKYIENPSSLNREISTSVQNEWLCCYLSNCIDFFQNHMQIFVFSLGPSKRLYPFLKAWPRVSVYTSFVFQIKCTGNHYFLRNISKLTCTTHPKHIEHKWQGNGDFFSHYISHSILFCFSFRCIV